MARPALTLAALAAAPLLAALACGTSGDEAGLQVTLLLESPASPPVDGAERRFTSDLGYQVRLTRGFLSLQSVDLGACASASRPAFSLLGTAHAHGGATPTRLGLALALSLLEPPGSERPLGSLAPPPGRYCDLSLGLRVADADAQGLPADGSMVGKTILVEGFYTPPGGGPEVAFQGSTTASASARGALAPLALGDGVTTATLALRMAGERWFDGIDLATSSGEQIGRGVLLNLGAGVSAASR